MPPYLGYSFYSEISAVPHLYKFGESCSGTGSSGGIPVSTISSSDSICRLAGGILFSITLNFALLFILVTKYTPCIHQSPN